ncbi:MAG: hypothetical protein JXA90_05530 [Planctomycetes bacterium]|nr:hypothetical protein [Planctomycetota bacterium]
MGKIRKLLLSMLIVAASSAGAKASAERFEDLRFTLPEGWTLKDHAAARGEALALSSSADVDLLARVWTREEEGAAVAKLALAAHPLPIAVHRFGAGAVRRRIEAGLRDAEGILRFEILDVRIVELDGKPAYRIRARVETSAESAEQLQYVISGRSTYVLGFSSASEEYARLESSFEEIVSTLVLSEGPPLLCRSSIWLWGGLWGTSLAAGLTLRSRRRGGSDRLRPLRMESSDDQ